MDSRRGFHMVIAEAQDALMARHRCSQQRAVELIVDLAVSNDVSFDEAAAQIVDA